MNTGSFKQNKTLRAGAVLVVIALITLIALSFTFAKYVSQGSGQDNARVAKWGVNIPIQEDLKLFSNAYGTGGDVSASGPDSIVDSSDGTRVIAPGTHHNVDVTLISQNKPEVMYDFNVSLSIEDIDSAAGAESLISKLDNYKPWKWTLGAAEFGKFADFEAAVKKLSQLDVPPNQLPTTQSINIGWKWDFEETAGYEKGAFDTSDTYLGNKAVTDALTHLKISLNVDAVQCQGGHSDQVTLSGTVTDGQANGGLDGATVKFKNSQTTTANGGKFSFLVDKGEGDLIVSKEGYDTATQHLNVTGPMQIDNPISLKPASYKVNAVATKGTYTGDNYRSYASSDGKEISTPVSLPTNEGPWYIHARQRFDSSAKYTNTLVGYINHNSSSASPYDFIIYLTFKSPNQTMPVLTNCKVGDTDVPSSGLVHVPVNSDINLTATLDSPISVGLATNPADGGGLYYQERTTKVVAPSSVDVPSGTTVASTPENDASYMINESIAEVVANVADESVPANKPTINFIFNGQTIASYFAEPAENYGFDGWTGVSDQPITQPSTITANFVQVKKHTALQETIDGKLYKYHPVFECAEGETAADLGLHFYASETATNEITKEDGTPVDSMADLKSYIGNLWVECDEGVNCIAVRSVNYMSFNDVYGANYETQIGPNTIKQNWLNENVISGESAETIIQVDPLNVTPAPEFPKVNSVLLSNVWNAYNPDHLTSEFGSRGWFMTCIKHTSGSSVFFEAGGYSDKDAPVWDWGNIGATKNLSCVLITRTFS